MTASTPTHWPEKKPDTLENLREYLRNHFNLHFTSSDAIQEFENVLEWIRSGSSEVLTWKGADSFSTMFISFHTGAPFMKELMHKYVFPKRLVDFLQICTELEKTTDQFAYVEKFEDIKDTDKITEHLQEFLKNLPTEEEFDELVREIHE